MGVCPPLVEPPEGEDRVKGDERENWHFIPKTRNGLTLKEMTPEQRKLAQALFASGFSQQGYNKATNIMSLEPVLFELEGAAKPRLISP